MGIAGPDRRPTVRDRQSRQAIRRARPRDGRWPRAARPASSASADAFITNLRPAALERLALDHEAVLARFPRLVYGSITGYGLDGPDRDRAGYDAGAFWARVGDGAHVRAAR